MTDRWARDRFGTRFKDSSIEREYVGHVEDLYTEFEKPVLRVAAAIVAISFLIFSVYTPEMASPTVTAGTALLFVAILYGTFVGRWVPGARVHWSIPAIGVTVSYVGSILYTYGCAELAKTVNCGTLYCAAGVSIFFPMRLWPRIVTSTFGIVGTIVVLKVAGALEATTLPMISIVQIVSVMLILTGVGIKNEIATRANYVTKRLLEESQRMTRAILINTIPESLALRLEAADSSSQSFVERFDEVSVLFADIVGFTSLAKTWAPERIANVLNEIFSRFDLICQAAGVEKIKTIGDAYLCVSGCPQRREDHALRIADVALEFREALVRFRAMSGLDIHIRIGVHTGPVVAGMLGRSRYSFDLWGDTVNLASRLESNGIVDSVTASSQFVEALNGKYEVIARGPVNLRGYGPLDAYILERPLLDVAQDIRRRA